MNNFEHEPQPTAEKLPAVVELDQRITGGSIVTLWWLEGTQDTYTTIDDPETGEFITLRTPEGKSAYDIFNHPYVYTKLPL